MSPGQLLFHNRPRHVGLGRCLSLCKQIVYQMTPRCWNILMIGFYMTCALGFFLVKSNFKMILTKFYMGKNQ